MAYRLEMLPIANRGEIPVGFNDELKTDAAYLFTLQHKDEQLVLRRHHSYGKYLSRAESYRLAAVAPKDDVTADKQAPRLTPGKHALCVGVPIIIGFERYPLPATDESSQPKYAWTQPFSFQTAGRTQTKASSDSPEKQPHNLSIEARVVGVDGKPVEKSSITFWKAIEPEQLEKSPETPMPGGDREHVWRDSATGKLWQPIHHYGAKDQATSKDLAPGEYRATACLTHHNPTCVAVSDVIRLDGSRQKTVVALAIEDGPSLAIKLVDQKTGKPIDGATLRLVRPDGLPIVPWSSYWQLRAAKGEYTFDHLAPGKYRLELWKNSFFHGEPDYKPADGHRERIIRIEPGKNQDLTVPMAVSRPGEQETRKRWPWVVEGTVTDPEGKPIEGATVHVSAGLATGYPVGRTTTNTKGKYILRFGPGGRVWDRKKRRWRAGGWASLYVTKPDMVVQGASGSQRLIFAEEASPEYAPRPAGEHLLFLPNKPYRLDFVMKPKPADPKPEKATESATQPTLPDWASRAREAGFRGWEVVEIDTKPSIRIGEARGHRLLLRRGRLEEINPSQQQGTFTAPDEDDSNFRKVYSHIEIVVFSDIDQLPDDAKRQIPWRKSIRSITSKRSISASATVCDGLPRDSL